MPHLIETYATNCGVRIDQPFIYEKYYPIPFDRYITLHTTSKGSKTYDYWDDVIQIITPALSAAGIKILQIGGKEDKACKGIHNLLGKTTINQTAYLIKHGLLHLGVDSFPVHVASAFGDKKIVALYSNNYAKVVGPYWGDKSGHVLLEPERDGRKPSFALEENPKTINTIRPEVIAEAVCNQLGLPFDWRFKTIYTGSYYKNLMVEMVPNQVVNIASLNLDSIIVRMDYEFCEEALEQQLRISNASIVTNRAIDLRLLAEKKDKVAEVVYFIEDNNAPDFVRDIQRIGIKCHLVTYLPDEDMNKHKLKFMEFGVLHKRTIPDDEVLKSHPGQKYYKSSKFLLSKEKIYISRLAMLLNRSIPQFGPVIDKVIYPSELEREFLKELECFSVLIDK